MSEGNLAWREGDLFATLMPMLFKECDRISLNILGQLSEGDVVDDLGEEG